MMIWVDADACPKVIKDILFRAAIRTHTLLILVANQYIATPSSPFINKVQVLSGFDMADNYIVQNMKAGDVVITGDIPLADQVIEKEGIALNPRGELYTPQNIKQRLAMRNHSDQLRSSGVVTEGPSSLSKKEIQTLANRLDQLLSQK